MVDNVYYNDVGSVASATPIGAAVSVLNNVVNNLFQKGLVNEQKNAVILQEKLATLSNAQQEQLNQQLAETTDANQQLQIILSAVGDSGAAANAAASKSQTYMAIALLGGSLLILGLVIFLSKSSAK